MSADFSNELIYGLTSVTTPDISAAAVKRLEHFEHLLPQSKAFLGLHLRPHSAERAKKLTEDFLVWQKVSGGGFLAETKSGAYRAATTPYGAFGASFRSDRGPLSAESKSLGEFETMEQAKVQCEQHHRENARGATFAARAAKSDRSVR